MSKSSAESVRLIVVEGPTAGAAYVLDRDVTVLGRSDPIKGIVPDFDLSPAEFGKQSSLSRRHAEILRSAGSFAIRDLGSANGTTVNGDAAPGASDPPRKLRDGDDLAIGRVKLKFSDPTATTKSKKQAESVASAAPASLPWRRTRIAAAAICMMALSVAVLGWAAPQLQARMLALPARVTGAWDSGSCAAYPEPCRAAMSAKLATQIADLDSLTARLAEALARTDTAVAEREARLAEQDRRIAQLRSARQVGRFPATVDGETYPSAAVADARLLAMAETRNILAGAVAQARDLRGDIIGRHAAAMSRRTEVQSQRDLLPVFAARQIAEATMAEFAKVQSDIDTMLREIAAEKTAAAPVLLSSEELLRR